MEGDDRMIKIDELKEPRGLRTYATEPELPEAVRLLVGKAIVEGIVPHIIQVQCSADFENTEEFEVILWGD